MLSVGESYGTSIKLLDDDDDDDWRIDVRWFTPGLGGGR